MQYVAIWDLDDTLVDTRHRLPLIQCTNPDWDKFHELIPYDTIIAPAFIIYNALKEYGVTPVIFTARPESVRGITQKFLSEHAVTDYKELLMRPKYNFSPSVIIKRSMLSQIRQHGCTPIVAFEDHPDVIKMYRQEGIMCWAGDDQCWQQGWNMGLNESQANKKRKQT